MNAKRLASLAVTIHIDHVPIRRLTSESLTSVGSLLGLDVKISEADVGITAMTGENADQRRVIEGTSSGKVCIPQQLVVLAKCMTILG